MGEIMLKEIVTKAVISKGKINESNDLELEINDNASKVIGCWVINHNYINSIENGKVYVNGSYDVHIWYALNNNTDTKIFKKTIEYKQEVVMVNTFDANESEYKVYCIEYPNCTSLQLKDNTFLLTIKKGLAVDVIGESKLLVQVSDNEELGINTNYIKR